jgi:tetratricopeptide (TPR) repeat protein
MLPAEMFKWLMHSGQNAFFRPLLCGLMLWVCCGALQADPAEVQSQIQQLYEEAQAARSRGDLPLSEQKYLEVIRLAPQLANAYHNLGIVYFMQRKYRESTNVLEKAVKLSPRLAGAHVILGLDYYQLYESQKAVNALQAALRLNPSDTNALLYLGKSQIQMRDYRSAAKTLERLVDSKPADAEGLYTLSLSYMKLMLESVNRLGEAAPQSYLFSLLMAQDAEARNDDETAISKYREALALRTKLDAVGIHYALGSVYARTGKYEEAAEEFKKELEVNPNDSLALWKLGELALRTDPQEARHYLERAVTLNPDLPQAVLAYGRALASTAETEKAVEQFQRVVRLAPEEDSVHYHLSKAYRLLGRDEQAKAEAARFQELAKKKSEGKREMARQLLELGRATQGESEEPEPGFSPSQDPAHP